MSICEQKPYTQKNCGYGFFKIIEFIKFRGGSRSSAHFLREVFLLHRNKLLKEFMDEAVRIVKEYFEKKHKITPGIIAGLHTFGARMNFNSHVHMLVTMGGMKENGEWKTYDFVPFEMLRVNNVRPLCSSSFAVSEVTTRKASTIPFAKSLL